MTTENNQTRYLTPNQWAKIHPWPPIGGIRHLIFHAKTNGFDKVVTRVGRAILLNESKFFDWMENQNKNEEL